MFRYMNNIVFEDYEQFIKEVDCQRREMLFPEKKLLEYKEEIIVDIENIDSVPNGRFLILYKNVLFECFFMGKQDKILNVFLNGALTQEAPQFNRWSYYKFIDGCMFNIADPMYRMYKDLKLGWYYGNKNINIREYIAYIVKRMAEFLKINNQNIIFWGSSGGGAAAIECASLIKDSYCVAINPQIRLYDYYYAEEFYKITGNSLKDDNIYRNDNINFLKNAHNSKFLLLVNIRSRGDMEQIKRICDELDITINYGINLYQNLIIWLYDAECKPYFLAHQAQEFYCIIFIIQWLKKNIDKIDKISKSGFINLINEFWRCFWKNERNLRKINLDIDIILRCREEKRKVAIWGVGRFAQELDKKLLDLRGRNYYNVFVAIDNNPEKNGNYFENIPIVCSKSINDWEDYFIIITSDLYGEDIQMQLEELNLRYGENFILWIDLYK